MRNEGGIIDHKTHTLEIRCIPSKLPDHINVNVSKLAVGDAIHISDLEVIEGVEYSDAPATVIVSCQPPTIVVETSTEDESAAVDEVPASKVKSDKAEATETSEAE